MTSNSDDASDAVPDPATAWVEQKAKDFSRDADTLRASTDRAAKGLTALASAGLTAVGIAKVGAVYPWPSEGWTWLSAIVLFLGFGAMVGSVVWFVVRFWKANRPLAMSASPKEPKYLKEFIDPDEVDEVDRIYKDAMLHAPFKEGGDESLASYEARADRWEEDALLTPKSPISERRLVQVARMRAEVDRAEQRAKVVIVRRRMTKALTGGAAMWVAALFVVGLIGFAVAADYLESERTHQACIAAFNTEPNGTALSPICETYAR